jgi:hypothetical protein
VHFFDPFALHERVLSQGRTAGNSPKNAEIRGMGTKKGFGQRTQEKQQIRETCRRPNRLNLSILTAEWG